MHNSIIFWNLFVIWSDKISRIACELELSLWSSTFLPLLYVNIPWEFPEYHRIILAYTEEMCYIKPAHIFQVIRLICHILYVIYDLNN